MNAVPTQTGIRTPAALVAVWFAELKAPGPYSLSVLQMSAVSSTVRPEHELAELRELLAGLVEIERELASVTRAVATPLGIGAGAGSAYVLALAERVAAGPTTRPEWWTAPEVDTLLSAVTTMQSQEAAADATRRQFAAQWGPEWESLASPEVRSVLEAAEALGSLLLPIPTSTSRRGIEEQLAFVDRTERMLQHTTVMVEEVGAMFGGSVMALPLRAAVDALEIAERLARLPQACAAWADPASLASARVTLDAIGDDLLTARAATALLADSYTDEVWNLDVDAVADSDDIRTALARVRLNGRPPADTETDLDRIAAAQRLRAAVAQMDVIGTRSFGHLWRRHLTDVEAIRQILDEIHALQSVLARSHDAAQLRSLLSGPVFQDPAFLLPLQNLVGAIQAWDDDARQHGHPRATDHTGAELIAWVRTARDAMQVWRSSFDAIPALVGAADAPLDSIRAASARAGALLGGGAAAARRAEALLAVGPVEDADWPEVTRRLEWVAETRLLFQDRAAPEAVARLLAARAVPDPSPIRHHLAAARRQVDRIGRQMDGTATTGFGPD